MIRPKCKFAGCDLLATKSYTSDKGVTYYRKFCIKHHEINTGKRERCQERRKRFMEVYRKRFKYVGKLRIDKQSESFSSCFLCGWDKSSCDIHRVKHGKNGGQYIKENIIPVCPNCHRLIHRGLI